MSSTWMRLESYCEPELPARDPISLILPHTEYGDYVGSLVNRANAETIVNDLRWSRWVRYVGEMYNTHYLVLDRSEVLEALRRAPDGESRRGIVRDLRSLADAVAYVVEDYPCLNDDLLGDLEVEAMSDAWDRMMEYMQMPDGWDELNSEQQAEASWDAFTDTINSGSYSWQYVDVYIREDAALECLAMAIESISSRED